MDDERIADLRALCATDHDTVRVSASTLASLLDALEDAQTSAETDGEMLAAAHAEIARLRDAADAQRFASEPRDVGWFGRPSGGRGGIA